MNVEPPANVVLTPVAPAERIAALDVLRGAAVLGILVVNIQSFAMVSATYMNPTVYGDLTGLNLCAWLVTHIFFDQKFISLFSLLFGAGIVLMTTKAQAAGGNSTGPFCRRMGWLIVIGLLHAYLVWYGDILVSYGLCGLVAYLFHKRSAKWLLRLGISSIAVSSLLFVLFRLWLYTWPYDQYSELYLSWQPKLEVIQEELNIYRSGWLEQMPRRSAAALGFQTMALGIWTAWRAGGMMLIGMALFKWQVLTGLRTRSFYVRLAAIGFIVGFALVIIGVISNFAMHWSLEYSMFLGSQFNYWGSVLVSLGYAAMVMLVCQTGRMRITKGLLANVGQMALTNYLLQSLICTIIFYGHGFGLFGKVERSGQIIIVAGVWLAMLTLSHFWLAYFRFGPVEWLWRSLTYKKMQPMIRQAPR